MFKAVSFLALIAVVPGLLVQTARAQAVVTHVQPEASLVTEASQAHPDLWPRAATPSPMPPPKPSSMTCWRG